MLLQLDMTTITILFLCLWWRVRESFSKNDSSLCCKSD